jgi:ribonuclease P protein component
LTKQESVQAYTLDHQRFLPEHHVRRGEDFQRAYRRRCSAADARIVVFGHPNGLSHQRLGLSVGRQFGGAVVRTRWKRLLREAFRQSREDLPAGIDLIVIPRTDAPPPLESLKESLVRLAGRVAKKIQT